MQLRLRGESSEPPRALCLHFGEFECENHPFCPTSEVTPHVRRHCFATPLLKAGTAIRTVQDLLGHESVETTQIYPPVMQEPGLGVRSPLDGRGC